MMLVDDSSYAYRMRKEVETFGDWLKRQRKKRGLSQSDLWRETGISKQYISGLEKNARQLRSGKLIRPGEDKVDKFAHTLGVPVAEARRVAGYASPATLGDTTKGQRAAEYVDGLPEDKQDDAIMYLQMLSEQYAQSPPKRVGSLSKRTGTDKRQGQRKRPRK